MDLPPLKIEVFPSPHSKGSVTAYTATLGPENSFLFVDSNHSALMPFGYRTEVHKDQDEFIVPLKGCFWVRVGNWVRVAAPGEIVFIPRGTIHDSGMVHSIGGVRFCTLNFSKVNLFKHLNQPCAQYLPRRIGKEVRIFLDTIGFLSPEVVKEKAESLSKTLESLFEKPLFENSVSRFPVQVIEWIERVQGSKAKRLVEFEKETGVSAREGIKTFRSVVGYFPSSFQKYAALLGVQREALEISVFKVLDLSKAVTFMRRVLKIWPFYQDHELALYLMRNKIFEIRKNETDVESQVTLKSEDCRKDYETAIRLSAVSVQEPDSDGGQSLRASVQGPGKTIIHFLQT